MAQKCEICERQTDFFENVDYGKKCLFHCDKSDGVTWGNPESEDVKRFWRAIREQIRVDLIGVNKNSLYGEHKRHIFDKYIFPVFETQKISTSMNGNISYSDDDNNFWESVTCSNLGRFGDVNTKRADIIFYLPVSCKNAYFQYGASFLCTTFNGWTKFDGSIFVGDAHFFDIRLGSYFYLDDVEFENMELTISDSNKNSSIGLNRLYIGKSFLLSCKQKSKQISFINVDIADKASVFIENVRCEELLIFNMLNKSSNIKFTDIVVAEGITIKNVLFDKTEFNGLNLEKANNIELKNTSFIGSHLTNVKWGEINEERFKIDRQMARQLKSINDAQGETVIANDFYALEMRLRSKELNWREHFGEKLVQNIHGLVSNHSNDWALPAIWFFAFGFLFATLAKYSTLKEVVFVLFLVVGGLIVFADKIPTKNYIWTAIGVLTVSFFVFVDSSATFEFLAALINPLNFKDSKNLLLETNLVLIYSCRLIEVFIGYQIITAIRKNTRRK